MGDDKYFAFIFDPEDDAGYEHVETFGDEKALVEWLTDYQADWGQMQIATTFDRPDFEPDQPTHVLILKGHVVVPKAVEVATRYEIKE